MVAVSARVQGPVRVAAGGPVVPGNAQPALTLGRDQAALSPQQTYEPKTALPGWVKLAGFAGIWGIWGFPAALLGAVGMWLAGKVIQPL